MFGAFGGCLMGHLQAGVERWKHPVQPTSDVELAIPSTGVLSTSLSVQ